jgi:hypothetical protein
MTEREGSSGASALRRRLGLVVGGTALTLGLVWMDGRWGQPLALPGAAAQGPLFGVEPWAALHPLAEVAKLVVAACIGLLVTAIHQPAGGDRPQRRSMAHAQVLLCVSGAMMMIIIGGSLARAFGIVGAASIIRFRTPVEDPKDVTILFLLMGLGMATGLGAYAVAGLATAFLCLFLLWLDREVEPPPVAMKIVLTAGGSEFPTDAVHAVFARHAVRVEPREIVRGPQASVTYLARLGPGSSIEQVSADLMREMPGQLESVSWEPAKRGLLGQRA